MLPRGGPTSFRDYRNLDSHQHTPNTRLPPDVSAGARPLFVRATPIGVSPRRRAHSQSVRPEQSCVGRTENAWSRDDHGNITILRPQPMNLVPRRQACF